MSYEYEHEYEPYEPVTTEGLEKAIKLESGVTIDLVSIQNEIDNYVRTHLQDRIKAMVKNSVELTIRDSWKAKVDFKQLLKEVIKEKVEEIYPDIVEDKVNQLAEDIKNMKVEVRHDEFRGKRILDAAHDKVDKYIENELKDQIKKEVAYLEQFSRNYFTNNLFRAMGMMDKMMPIAQPEQVSGAN